MNATRFQVRGRAWVVTLLLGVACGAQSNGDRNGDKSESFSGRYDDPLPRSDDAGTNADDGAGAGGDFSAPDEGDEPRPSGSAGYAGSSPSVPSDAPGGVPSDAPGGVPSDAPGGVPSDVQGSVESNPLVVPTSSGKLHGVSADGVDQFLGIPYAQAPIGALRLASPVALETPDVERNSKAPGDVCLQYVGTSSQPRGGEDCLFLNVYRPANANVNVDAKKALPVMVWIHGGSFDSGAGSDYVPNAFVASNEVIVVTLNYRLGALGFVAGDGLTGDYGLQDQLTALRWVHKNIAAFGGDPANVTIDGESAGAGAVCAHVTLPGEGLFSRAIIQSGSCGSIPVDLASSWSKALESRLNCASGLGACLRDSGLSAESIVSASRASGMKYGIVAGSGLVTRAPWDVVVAGQQQRVPILIGDIKDEMAFFMSQEAKYVYLTKDGYRTTLASTFPSVKPEEIMALYPLANYGSPFLALSAAYNDSGYYYAQQLGGCVTAAVASAFANSTATYAYELDDPNFTWVTGGRGATHMTDLVYLFELREAISQPFNDTQRALSKQMVEAWGQFIRNGVPSADGAAWPRTPAGKAQASYLEPGVARTTVDLAAKHNCAFWYKVLTPTASPSP